MRAVTVRALLLITGCAALAGCSSKPLGTFGEVPAFQLTDQLGRTFDRSALNGHVWIADFVFTNCEGPCPRMSSHMRAMQQKTGSSVKLVSFTVDPTRDTPAVLSAYGKRFQADPSRWSFLTGDPKVLDALDHDVFHLGSVGAGLDHSTRFVLIDKKGQIRGYYGISDGDPVARIARDAARLERDDS